jgi:hypothetical protein
MSIFDHMFHTQLLFQIYVAIHFSGVVPSVTATALFQLQSCILHNLKKYLNRAGLAYLQSFATSLFHPPPYTLFKIAKF